MDTATAARTRHTAGRQPLLSALLIVVAAVAARYQEGEAPAEDASALRAPA